MRQSPFGEADSHSVDQEMLSLISVFTTERNSRVGKILRIREVPGSKLGLETGYPDSAFCGFSQSLQANSEKCLKLGQDRFLPHPFKFIVDLSSFHLKLYNLSY
jgi:hypothetical protein